MSRPVIFKKARKERKVMDRCVVQSHPRKSKREYKFVSLQAQAIRLSID